MRQTITSVIWSSLPKAAILVPYAVRPAAASAHAALPALEVFVNDKVFKLLLAAGTLISFAGLLFLPAAFNSETRDPAMLGAGLAFFGLGALIIGLALYLHARGLRSSINADPNMLSMLNAKRKGICDSCGAGAPMIQCTMHRVSLCATCLVQHYDPRGCVYVPALRKSGKSSRAAAANRA